MKIQGENIIPADQETVWNGLNDPEVLRQSIPGCESLEKVDDHNFKAKVTSRIGPITATFNGDVALSNLNPPHSYTLSGSGSAGAKGGAKGSADVKLEPVDGGTKLTYDVDAEVSGKLAQLGGRLIQSTAGVLAGQFFNRFSEVVAPTGAGAKTGLPVPLWAIVVGGGVLAAIVVAIVFAVS